MKSDFNNIEFLGSDRLSFLRMLKTFGIFFLTLLKLYIGKKDP